MAFVVFVSNNGNPEIRQKRIGLDSIVIEMKSGLGRSHGNPTYRNKGNQVPNDFFFNNVGSLLLPPRLRHQQRRQTRLPSKFQ